MCFEKLKIIMTSYLVLAFPGFLRPFDLHCDALGEDIGVVLSQDHPIAFKSRKL